MQEKKLLLAKTMGQSWERAQETTKENCRSASSPPKAADTSARAVFSAADADGSAAPSSAARPARCCWVPPPGGGGCGGSFGSVMSQWGCRDLPENLPSKGGQQQAAPKGPAVLLFAGEERRDVLEARQGETLLVWVLGSPPHCC